MLDVGVVVIMSEIYATGSDGERLLAEYLSKKGRQVEFSDTKTFDLKVDGRYAEVKSSKESYESLGFVGLTENQYRALREGLDFTLFLVCNVSNPEALQVIEMPAQDLLKEEPVVECTYYWYRSQIETIREG